jgi:hypothetical protein
MLLLAIKTMGVLAIIKDPIADRARGELGRRGHSSGISHRGAGLQEMPDPPSGCTREGGLYHRLIVLAISKSWVPLPTPAVWAAAEPVPGLA